MGGYWRAPLGIVLNMDAPFRLFKADHGVGLSIWYDELGFNEDINLSFPMLTSSMSETGNSGWALVAALQTGNFSLNGTFRRLLCTVPRPGYSHPVGWPEWVYFDLGAGLFYRTEELYVGISSTHLLQDEFVYQTEGTSPTAQAKEKMVRITISQQVTTCSCQTRLLNFYHPFFSNPISRQQKLIWMPPSCTIKSSGPALRIGSVPP